MDRSTRVLIDGDIAVVTHVGTPWSCDRESGEIYLRLERGGHELTADGPLQPAPGYLVDEGLR
ncbi:hypothetical protein [Streptomyces syringium]|uniref:hypothetical protein n=1 Tax=Streptomyces syringium TaxID=76729 RepID=UPI0033DAC08F